MFEWQFTCSVLKSKIDHVFAVVVYNLIVVAISVYIIVPAYVVKVTVIVNTTSPKGEN